MTTAKPRSKARARDAKFAGRALSDKPCYRCCRLVEFAHEQVIASHRDHPEHAAFAHGQFRPIAADRTSIDFAETSEYPGARQANGAQRARA